MAYYKLPEKATRKFVEDLYEGYGFTRQQAIDIADVLLMADLYGIESHGIQRLIRYHDGIQEGLICPKAEPVITHETKLSAVIDAKMAMGQVVSKMAMQMAIDKAKEHGFGAVVVNHSNHYGIAGYYTRMAVEQDMMGFCFTNTEAIAIPTNGKNAMLGTNPIAFGMPADPTPFLYDVATTVVPRGKLEVYNKKDAPLPMGWVVDANGLDTTNAGEVIQNIINKAGGGILPIGGSSEATGSHKGYGLGAIVEILTAIMAGGVTSNHVSHCGNGDTSEAFWAIDYGMFGDKATMRKNCSVLLEELRNSAKAEGQTRIYTHGEKELESTQEKLRDGLPANEKTIGEMQKIGATVGINFEDYFGKVID